MTYPPRILPKSPSITGKKNAPAKGLPIKDLSKNPAMEKNKKSIAKKKERIDK
jgi:hypothetical protein